MRRRRDPIPDWAGGRVNPWSPKERAKRHALNQSDGAALFKPWIVRRPDGGCQVLFPLTELDGLVDAILKLTRREP